MKNLEDELFADDEPSEEQKEIEKLKIELARVNRNLSDQEKKNKTIQKLEERIEQLEEKNTSEYNTSSLIDVEKPKLNYLTLPPIKKPEFDYTKFLKNANKFTDNQNDFVEEEKEEESYVQKNKLKARLAAIQQTLASEKNNHEAWYEKSVVRESQDKIKKALVCINNALAYDPTNPKYVYQKGVLLSYTVKHLKAKRYLKRAIKLDPTNIKYRNYLDKYKQEMKDLRKR